MIPFRKMQGLGNDFVVFDARQRAIPMTPSRAKAIAAPVVFLSALNATGVDRLFDRIKLVNESAFHRVTTGELNRFVETLKFEERKVLYITQASVRPPSFVLFTDKAGPLHFSHERYLMNQLRRRFGFEGTPIHLKIRGRVRKKERPRG